MESLHLTLISYSTDEKIFFVNHDVCQISKLLSNSIKGKLHHLIITNFQILLIGGFKEGENPDDGIKLDIDSEILEICIKFMHYKTV